jgi:hypothetical protein
MTNLNFPQREDIWFLVNLTTQCAERAAIIKQENIDVADRLESLVIVLNDAVHKLSKLQDSNKIGIEVANYYYQNLINKI